jgi:hypothetical protein
MYRQDDPPVPGGKRARDCNSCRKVENHSGNQQRLIGVALENRFSVCSAPVLTDAVQFIPEKEDKLASNTKPGVLLREDSRQDPKHT